MKTINLFFDNPELIANETVITNTGADERGFFVIPRESCYFPGGGGQEADSGEIVINGALTPITGGKIIDEQLRLYIEPPERLLESGTSIGIRIDARKRTLNSRLHSAGHLLSSVIYEEMKLDLLPVKGYHFDAGSHVEFASNSGVNGVDIEEVNKRLAFSIEAQLPIKSQIVTPVTDAFLHSFRTPGFLPSEDAAVRLVKIGDFLAYACGGTHVLHTGQLEGLKVTGFRSKKGNLKIKYEFDLAT